MKPDKPIKGYRFSDKPCPHCDGTGLDYDHIWDKGPPIDYFHCQHCAGTGDLIDPVTGRPL